jgi:hypothetical protein
MVTGLKISKITSKSWSNGLLLVIEKSIAHIRRRSTTFPLKVLLLRSIPLVLMNMALCSSSISIPTLKTPSWNRIIVVEVTSSTIREETLPIHRDVPRRYLAVLVLLPEGMVSSSITITGWWSRWIPPTTRRHDRRNDKMRRISERNCTNARANLVVIPQP